MKNVNKSRLNTLQKHRLCFRLLALGIVTNFTKILQKIQFNILNTSILILMIRKQMVVGPKHLFLMSHRLDHKPFIERR